MSRGPNRLEMNINKIIDGNPDRGCKYADEFLGMPKGGSRCLECPFGEGEEGGWCVADMTPKIRQGYIQGFSIGETKGLMAGLTLGLDLEKYTNKREVK